MNEVKRYHFDVSSSTSVGPVKTLVPTKNRSRWPSNIHHRQEYEEAAAVCDACEFCALTDCGTAYCTKLLGPPNHYGTVHLVMRAGCPIGKHAHITIKATE